MKKCIIVIFLFFSFSSILAQKNVNQSYKILGEVLGTSNNEDSIFLFEGQINEKYFRKRRLSASLKGEKYELSFKFDEPMMYRFILLSDTGRLIWRAGRYFIDNTTTSISSNLKNNECNSITGITAKEYKEVFIPFITKQQKNYNCEGRVMENLEEGNDLNFDTLLYSYVKTHPSSYVALWQLINRFNRHGHSVLRNQILNSFTQKIKSRYLWNTLNKDFNDILIKEKSPFPIINLKDTNYKIQSLKIPKNEYTLIDFWFSRCKPCLESFPSLKKVYGLYNKSGFNIISISTDKTKEVVLWEKRIKDFDLSWDNYLDENGVQSKKLLIDYFPTNFLLDSRGRVIQKNISIEDLNTFLIKNLH